MTEKKTVKVFNRSLGLRMQLEATYVVSGRTRGIFADMLERFAYAIVRRQRKNYQTVVVVTGRTGSGKSNLAVQLAMEIARQLGETWDVVDNYIYELADLKRKLTAYQENPQGVSRINLMDEGTVILSNRSVMAKEDRGIVTLFETLRSYGFITILCAPSFARLNMSIRENLTDYLVVCPDKRIHPNYPCRGSFEVFEPNYARWEQGIYWTHLGSGTFPPLEGEVKERYEKIKLAHQRKITDKMLGIEKKPKNPVGRPRKPDNELKHPRCKSQNERIKRVDEERRRKELE